jgi:hypothetical protein
LVRIPAQVPSRGLPLHCKICRQELASTDDGNILKYFFVGRVSNLTAGTVPR